MNKKQIKFSIGSDPEYFLAEKNTEKIVNAIPILKHGKENPIDAGNGVKVYTDNVLVEATVNPAHGKDEFIANIKDTYQKIQKSIGAQHKIVAKAAHIFAKEDLNSKEAWEIGCTPSLNAWDKRVVNVNEFPGTMRSSAGHIHIGHEKLTEFQTRNDAIQLLDIILGTSLVVMGQEDSSASIRRKIYGEAGNFRKCKYGAEYRTPDSFYLRSPKTVSLVYDLITYTLGQLFNGNAKKILKTIKEKEVRKAIDSCDKDLSLSILKKIKLPQDLLDRVCADWSNLDLYKEWELE